MDNTLWYTVKVYAIMWLIITVFTVTTVNTSVVNSRHHTAPFSFYVGTTLNLTCLFDLPDTVDPVIINGIKWFKNSHELSTGRDRRYYTMVFHPLDFSDVGIYKCAVRLAGQYNYVGGSESMSLDIKGKPCFRIMDYISSLVSYSCEPFSMFSSATSQDGHHSSLHGYSWYCNDSGVYRIRCASPHHNTSCGVVWPRTVAASQCEHSLTHPHTGPGNGMECWPIYV